MAAVDPTLSRHARLDRVLLHCTRICAASAYAAAVVVAYVLLAPVLPFGGPAAAPAAPERTPTLYEIRDGESLPFVAAVHGVSLAELLALNRGTDSLSLEPGLQLRVE